MDINTVTELITNLGFPIALVIAMGFFIWKIYQQSVKREEKLMQEITENRLVNEQAIETLALYAERIGVIEADIKDIKSIISQE
jgi:hypothetical protein